MPARVTDSAQRDDFRLSRRRPLLAGVLLLVIATVSHATVQHDLGDIHATGEAFWLAAVGYLIFAMAIGALWLAWRRPALVRVGPEGLHLTPGYARPFSWSDIRDLRYQGVRIGLANVKSVLEFELAPEAEIPGRWKNRWMAAVDRWYARKFTLRAPLWLLAEPEEDILASVERFHPVTRIR